MQNKRISRKIPEIGAFCMHCPVAGPARFGCLGADSTRLAGLLARCAVVAPNSVPNTTVRGSSAEPGQVTASDTARRTRALTGLVISSGLTGSRSRTTICVSSGEFDNALRSSARPHIMQLIPSTVRTMPWCFPWSFGLGFRPCSDRAAPHPSGYRDRDPSRPARSRFSVSPWTH